MQLKILCPQWGLEQLGMADFFAKAKGAGYDGVDTWLPENKTERERFIRLLEEFDMVMVSHQHEAKGNNIAAFCKSFEYYLHIAAESNPILINSHSGRDFFGFEQQLQVIDTAENFSIKNNIKVVHETHRGRMCFSPGNAQALFAARPDMKITADFSHWVCVTESFLEDFEETLNEAIARTEHIHARVGFIQGPQVPDPRKPFWQKEVQFFLKLWKQIFKQQQSTGKDIFTITTEFGPPPYMWTDIVTNEPVASQWDINVYMKDLLAQIMQADSV